MNSVSKQQFVIFVNLDIIGMNKLHYVKKYALFKVVNHVRILIVMFVKMECLLVRMDLVLHSLKILLLMQMSNILLINNLIMN